jgi:hypothetical protein
MSNAALVEHIRRILAEPNGVAIINAISTGRAVVVMQPTHAEVYSTSNANDALTATATVMARILSLQPSHNRHQRLSEWLRQAREEAKQCGCTHCLKALKVDEKVELAIRRRLS